MTSCPHPLDSKAICLLLISTLTVMSNVVVSPSLPGLANKFKHVESGAFLATLILPMPALSIVLFAPIMGIAADRFGRKPLLVVSLAVFVVAGVSGAVLNTIYEILISRAVLGFGVAGLMTSATALAGDYFTGVTRTRFMGMQQAFNNIGGIAFVVSAGFLATISPRMPFYIYGAAIVLLPMIMTKLYEPEAKLASSETRKAHYPNWKGIVTACCVLVFSHFMVFYVLPTQLPFYMVEIGISNPSITGITLGAATLSGACSALLSTRLKTRFGAHGVNFIGFGFMALGFATLAVADSLKSIMAASACIGVAMGSVMPMFMEKIMEVTPQHYRGTASGAVTTCIFLGQFTSPFVSNLMFDAFDYQNAFWMMSVLSLSLAIVGSITHLRSSADKAGLY